MHYYCYIFAIICVCINSPSGVEAANSLEKRGLEALSKLEELDKKLVETKCWTEVEKGHYLVKSRDVMALIPGYLCDDYQLDEFYSRMEKALGHVVRTQEHYSSCRQMLRGLAEFCAEKGSNRWDLSSAQQFLDRGAFAAFLGELGGRTRTLEEHIRNNLLGPPNQVPPIGHFLEFKRQKVNAAGEKHAKDVGELLRGLSKVEANVARELAALEQLELEEGATKVGLGAKLKIRMLMGSIRGKYKEIRSSLKGAVESNKLERNKLYAAEKFLKMARKAASAMFWFSEWQDDSDSGSDGWI